MYPIELEKLRRQLQMKIIQIILTMHIMPDVLQISCDIVINFDLPFDMHDCI